MILKSGDSWWPDEVSLAGWRAAYSHLDVDEELERAKVWLLANPGKRKTSRGMNRFCVNWLATAARDLAQVRRVGAYVAPRGPKPTYADPAYAVLYHEAVARGLSNLAASQFALRKLGRKVTDTSQVVKDVKVLPRPLKFS